MDGEGKSKYKALFSSILKDSDGFLFWRMNGLLMVTLTNKVSFFFSPQCCCYKIIPKIFLWKFYNVEVSYHL